ncbi:MAG: ABC transporter ATP-binding protein [Clostridia bacterium]|nr:ABC transporter ATP-binding protein [Clostridia bacterium]
MLLQAEKIAKQYFRKTGTANYFYAVRPLTLEIRAGEVAVLTGRSGSGKTTLLNMLSGLLRPTEGTVRLGNSDLYSLGDTALSRIRSETIGIVPQGRSAIDTLTVMENILLPGALYGRAPSPETAAEWMEKLGIVHLADSRPAELSGGELRRMAIARALTQKPELIFADEPTGDLDNENTGRVLSILHEYAHARNKAVFVVTHENDALEYADRVYVLDNGQLSVQ